MGKEQEALYMEIALEEARRAAERGEVPVGAVLVGAGGEVLARDGNRTIELHDPCAHAEILVLRRAGEKTANYRLGGTTIYVTVEPCVMCAGALVHARVSRLVFGADDVKAGGVVSRYGVGMDKKLNHTLLVEGGLLAEQCSSVMSSFFRERRKKAKDV